MFIVWACVFMHAGAEYHSDPFVSHEILLQGQRKQHCTNSTNIHSSARVYISTHSITSMSIFGY